MRAFVVDAFTSVPFHGNPAGVVLLDAPAESSWMQSVAAELRHSETAFVTVRPDGGYDLRWFTPAAEVRLCGHATLATTHALASTGSGPAYTFHTLSGVLTTSVDDDGLITMVFPAHDPLPTAEPVGLADALGCAVLAVRRADVDLLVEVTDARTVRELTPDLTELTRVDAQGVIVTAAADSGADHDFVSRYFAPRIGVDEDPVTGSTHCTLGPFWAARLGRDVLTGVQSSARGGRLGVSVRGDRVELRGHAVTVLDGTLTA